MLTGKQRSYLKNLANELPAILQVGKGGVNAAVIEQFNEALEARELVKGRVLKNSPVDAREACEEIAEATGADIVQVIGSIFVLYRESKENKVIELP